MYVPPEALYAAPVLTNLKPFDKRIGDPLVASALLKFGYSSYGDVEELYPSRDESSIYQLDVVSVRFHITNLGANPV